MIQARHVRDKNTSFRFRTGHYNICNHVRENALTLNLDPATVNEHFMGNIKFDAYVEQFIRINWSIGDVTSTKERSNTKRKKRGYTSAWNAKPDNANEFIMH